MGGQTVFRIAGALLTNIKLPDQFGGNDYVQRSVYKLFAERTTDELVAVTAQHGRDIVVIKISGGPTLILHPVQAADLFNSTGIKAKGEEGDVAVSSVLPWNFPRPGRLYGAKLTAVDASADWFAILRPRACTDEATSSDVPCDLQRSGLFPVREVQAGSTAAQTHQPAFSRKRADAQTYLVFIHGIFAQSCDTFGAMWEPDENGTNRSAPLAAQYGEHNVLAFDHPSLTVGPIQNALTLAKSLPAGATVDIIAHGTGGLIAEALVRATVGAPNEPSHARPLHEEELADIPALRECLRSRAITVRRIVRVACPIRGNLLASQRPAAWLSVALWLARVSGMNCNQQWASIISRIALHPQAGCKLAGLAALNPDGPLIRWLGSAQPACESELYIVAGDSEGDSLFGWLQTFMSDALLWTDSDLLVQTRAMFGGVARSASRAMMLLLRDDRITHFTYFQRRQTINAILSALNGSALREAQPGAASMPGEHVFDGWVPIRPASQGADSVRSPRALGQFDGRKPWLLLVPDVFGSILASPEGGEFWLGEPALTGFRAFALDPKKAVAIEPRSLVDIYYGELRAHFERTHHVIEFPYDWRNDLRTGARHLDNFVAEVFKARRLGDQPLRILAHGMGGLLVRAWHANHADTWERFTGRTGARVMLLGVPNTGCLLPLRLLSGDETFGTILNGTSSITDESSLRHVLAGMPGILQLQGTLRHLSLALGEREQWCKLESAEFRAQRSQDRWHGIPDTPGARQHLDSWGIPPDEHFALASEFWAELERSLPAFVADREKVVVVGGTGFTTVTGVETRHNDLFFLTSRDGDRQVAIENAGLPALPLWLVAAPHDALTRTTGAFAALSELIERGTTTRLSNITPPRPERGTAATKRREARRLPSHGGREFADRAVAQPQTVEVGNEDGQDESLNVKVHHGDLRFVREPLLVGHYRSMTLTGTEAAIDSLIGNRMSTALRTGVYPERVGSFQIFENGWHRSLGRRKQRYIPRPRAAVIVGLGEEGELTAQELAYTLRIGVLAYAERFAENSEQQESFELAATLTGSGGTGVTVSMATVALLQGVLDANVRLRAAGWPFVATLTIVELYLDRASDALRVLNMQAATMTQLRVGKVLHIGDGGLRRPVHTSYRGAGYDFISALKSAESTPTNPVIAYALDTRRARTEVRAQRSQGTLVRDLVCKGANTREWNRQIGRTLFNLLIPVEIEPYLTGSSDMVMELDATTAALPWEMLDTDPPNAPAQQSHSLPWAIRCKVLRKLRTDKYRQEVLDAATEDKILIIGDPLTQGPKYPSLAGARTEASSVAAVARTSLRLQRDHVLELNERPDANTIINALFASRYRIVHIAGHGSEPDSSRGSGNGGVVLSGENTFLGANEVRAMRVTPELVFLNCCHLAAGPAQEDYDRVAFAAVIARELIDIGVRCVVVAGWAIEDKPAEVFAKTFYREIFSGKRFIDAVGAGRAACYESKRESNTWAAYQCYGDPDWSWKIASASAQSTPEEEYEGIASPTSLILALQALSSDLLYTAQDTSARNKARLEYLVTRFNEWTSRGDVAQELAAAFAALPDRREAIAWYRKASKAKDGSASITAVELQAEQLSQPGAGEEELNEAIDIFDQLIKRLGRSLNRLSLLGNAYRRLNMLLQDSGEGSSRGEEAFGYLEHARRCYADAAKCEPEATNRFYPLRAVITCRIRFELAGGSKPAGPAGGQPPENSTTCTGELLEREFAEVSLAIGRALRVNPNFWPIVAQSELEILKGVVKRNLAVRQHDISASLRDLHNRISTPRFWVYVHDDARAVLGPYERTAGVEKQPAESEAARRLLGELEKYSRSGAGRAGDATHEAAQGR